MGCTHLVVTRVAGPSACLALALGAALLIGCSNDESSPLPAQTGSTGGSGGVGATGGGGAGATGGSGGAAGQGGGELPSLRVSDDGRYLVQGASTPFFWLGDTAWGIYRNSFLEATTTDIEGQPVEQSVPVEHYFSTRAAQGFNVIQTQLLPLPQSLDGRIEPAIEDQNAYGHEALLGGNSGDFTQPVTVPNGAPDEINDYWDYVDTIIDLAGSHGIYVAIVPAWNNHLYQANPIWTDPAVAYTYGHWLGERYASRTHRIIWVLGGDGRVSPGGSNPITQQDEDRNFAMAEGIADGVNGQDAQDGQADYSTTLMTFHPPGGGQSSSDHAPYHQSPWLDFNMVQTSAFIRHDNYQDIAQDYALTPTKPTFDGEASYEHSESFENNDGDARCQPWHTRRAAYWAVFAGAFGHSYGHRNLVHFDMDGQVAARGADGAWFDSLEFEAALDMIHLRRLMESRPMLSRIPDQSLIVGGPGSGTVQDVNRVQATRDAGGQYAMLYSSNGRNLRVDLTQLTASSLTAWWFDPRSGDATEVQPAEIVTGELSTSSAETVFDPPGPIGDGEDWVLVIDDAAQGFSAPGQ